MNQSQSEFGLIYRILRMFLKPWLGRVRLLTPRLEELKTRSLESQLYFVGQLASFIDLLVINDALIRKEMTPIRATHGINPFLIHPFSKAWGLWSRIAFRPESVRAQIEEEFLFEMLQRGEPGYLFLKRRPRLFSTRLYYYKNLFSRLARENDERGDRTVLAPSTVFLTRKRKTNASRSTFEVFFGTYDFPGRFRKAWQLLVGAHRGGILLSEPINLEDEYEKTKSQSPGYIDKRLRWVLLFHLNNEDRAYRGPTKQPVDRKVRKILKEKRLVNELEKVAKRQNRSRESVFREAERTLRHIASDTSDRPINVLRIIFDFFFAKTIEGFDIREEDLRLIRELNRKGPVVFLPSHRSHVDYLILAYTFEIKGLNNPRFAAGENLAKWPIGPILRRAGGMFIRRSFKGEVIFPLVFEAYIRHVLRNNHMLVFFPEGGRSRTGKLLHPKVGMMAMVLDAWQQGIVDDLPLVPICIDYGKVFEGESYLREKSGGEKRQENIASVLRSGKVLKRKHGVIRIRLGDPIMLGEYVAAKGHSSDSLGFKTKIPFLHRLGRDVMHSINQNVTLTAGNIVAGLLLGNPRRGMAMKDLHALFVISVRYLRARAELAFLDQGLEIALNNALATFERWETIVQVKVSGETVINIPEQKRSEMEYYKNNGIHYIVEQALFCSAFHVLSPSQRTFPMITEVAEEMYHLLQQEFIVREDFPTEQHMRSAYGSLEVIDALKLDDDRVEWSDYQVGRLLVQINGQLLANFLESYFVAAEELFDIPDGEQLDRKKWIKNCLARAKLLHAVGSIRHLEASNTVTFKNALTRFNKLGFVKVSTNQNNKQVLVSIKNREAFAETKARLFGWITELD